MEGDVAAETCERKIHETFGKKHPAKGINKWLTLSTRCFKAKDWSVKTRGEGYFGPTPKKVY
jgi:hypothetical protein